MSTTIDTTTEICAFRVEISQEQIEVRTTPFPAHRGFGRSQRVPGVITTTKGSR